ncbi:kinesin-like protein KIFC2 isoform X7 [Desmodus rotundus]|uniref:kinesin-like protein KIFC2 isoform X7 n=1 Tax=Desmodus rotundus TaxID=9430 RepID=UPI0023815EF1|nr:kinesin-like protein KIFC2 isoform X7 [Desmodus rotundus]
MALRGESSGGLLGEQARIPWKGGAGPWGRPSRACAPALLRAGERARSPGAGTRGGAKPGPLPPRAPMYAFYSLLIYIFYSLFRRDVGAKATADPKDPNQTASCKPEGSRSPDQPPAELWTELTGLVGRSESEDGPGGGAEGRPAEVSLEEALVRLAEFLSVQLGAEESCGYPPDLSKPGDVPPLLTVTGQLLALLAWIRSPRGRQALPQGVQPTSGVQPPTPAGPTSPEESPSFSLRGEAQGQQTPQLEEDQRAWQRLEQLLLGQLEELKQQLDLQDGMGQLHLGVGATDSEKRVQHLTLENEALKQSLILTQDLLRHWGPGPHTRAPQEEAEALVELQGQLQEAQDATEALRVQVSWALGALSASGAGTQLPEEQLGPPTGCPERLLELKGNIRVLCRLRPGTPSSLVSSEPGPGGTVTTCYRGHQRRFRLDWVFPPDASQEEVFRELEPTVLSCLRGYSVCIFTYGQTGTGKTYSMEGPPEDPGIAPRALQSLFREMRTGGQHCVTLSMVEIYNEAVRDLLAPGPPQRLVVRQGPAGQGGLQVAGLTYWDVPNLETLNQMLSLGRSNRATAATAMNQHSSRSHALVTLTLRAASPTRGSGTAGTSPAGALLCEGPHHTGDWSSLYVGSLASAGTLHLVDLAGSERAWKAGAACRARGDPEDAQRLREARTINRSLLALGGVMAALRARRPHVPFRDSQLTRLLQPALGSGATVVLLLQVGARRRRGAGAGRGRVVCMQAPLTRAAPRQISTRPEDLGETVCSLKFAERVGQVELGPARRRRAPRSGTPSSLSTDTPFTGTPCTPTPSPGSPPSPSPDSGSSSARAPPGNLLF